MLIGYIDKSFKKNGKQSKIFDYSVGKHLTSFVLLTGDFHFSIWHGRS